MKSENIKKLNDEYMMPTYKRFDVALESGNGALGKDFDGRTYIDMASGFGVNSLGYADKGFADAVMAQLLKIQHTSNLYYNEPCALLAKQLCEKSKMKKAFFANSGAEANECAIKLARKYQFDKTGGAKKSKIATLYNSFHGRTITTLSATGQDVFHNYFFPFTDGFYHVKANCIEDLEKINVAETAAIMVECIQGEGGVNLLDEAYLKAVEKLCSKNDILLIVDEVQTGMGRTGKLFAYEHYEIAPDIITLAKGLGGGLPIGACLCNERLQNVLNATTHGTTFGGNPVVCAGANYVLSQVCKDGFLDEVAKKGEYIAAKLSKINGVTGVRKKGLIIGIELEMDNAAEIAQRCVESGLLVLTAKSVLRLLPPLNITYEQIDKAMEILNGVIGHNIGGEK